MKKKRFWLGFGAALGLCFAFRVLFFSDWLNIQRVEVVASGLVDEPMFSVDKQGISEFVQGQTRSGFFKTSLFFFNSSKAEKSILAAFPGLREAEIKKRPGHLIVSVSIRIAAFAVCFESQENCFLADNEAIIFQKINQREGSMPRILILSRPKNLLEPAFDEAIWNKIEEINGFFQNQARVEIVDFLLEEGRFLKANTKRGFYVYFDLQNDTEFDLVRFKLLLEKEITEAQQKTLEYIDLRFSKAYYK